MSVALDSNRRVESSGISRAGAKFTKVFETRGISPADRSLAQGRGEVPGEKESGDLDACSSSPTSSSSSSIGRNSDLSERSSDGEDNGENEVQSSYKGPLEMMESLEEVLPIRKGISSFYSGKSKSFTSLVDASYTSSVKDIAKPENAYTRKRRNQLAFNLLWDKNRSPPLRGNGGGISKRPIGSSKSSLALAVAMSSSESNSSDESNSSSNSRSPPRRPPLHPQARASHSNLASLSPPQRSLSAWRSYSLADLQECVPAPANASNSLFNKA